MERLLRAAVDDGRRVLAAFVTAIALRGGGPATHQERLALARSLAAVHAAADLLGRVKAIRLHERHYGTDTFAAERDTFATLPGLPVFRPLEALRYFLSLVPRLGINPRPWGQAVERQALTLARATELTVIDKVRRVVERSLEGTPEAVPARPAAPPVAPAHEPLVPQRHATPAMVYPHGPGFTAPTPTEAIHRALQESSIADPRGAYSSMVWRTNVNDALTTGFDRQLTEPDMQKDFPAWRYDGITDGREGDDHRPKFGRYYPASATFSEVRGPRVFNCRCTRVPVTADRWAKLQASGVRLETSW